MGIIRQACSQPPLISKSTILATFPADDGGTGTWLHTIPVENWTITAFDPQNRTVCIDVTTPVGLVTHAVLIIPIQGKF